MTKIFCEYLYMLWTMYIFIKQERNCLVPTIHNGSESPPHPGPRYCKNSSEIKVRCANPHLQHSCSPLAPGYPLYYESGSLILLPTTNEILSFGLPKECFIAQDIPFLVGFVDTFTASCGADVGAMHLSYHQYSHQTRLSEGHLPPDQLELAINATPYR